MALLNRCLQNRFVSGKKKNVKQETEAIIN